MREAGLLDANLERMFRWFVDDSIEEVDENVFKKISCDLMACFAYNNRDIPMEIKKLMDKQRANKYDATNANRIK